MPTTTAEDAFIELLSQIGYTEETYRESLSQNLMTQKLYDAVAPVEDPTDDEIIAYANENLNTYNGASARPTS